MSTVASSFNLIDEGWIRCLMQDGSTRCLSLREIFGQLTDVVRLSGDSPQQDYAVFRVLLAILWRSHAQTDKVLDCDNFIDWWYGMFGGSASELTDPVFTYLEEHRSRFDLLDPVAPFMQVADLATPKNTYSEVQRLIPEAESDYFTMRAGSGKNSLTLSEAARWVIAMQAWDYSGIKPGAVGDPRVKGGKGYPIGTGWAGYTGGVVIHGSNLFETLLFNTPADFVFGEDTVDKDLPSWEREPATAAPRSSDSPEGPADILTWQSRRIRLFRADGSDDITGVLISNGDKIEIRNQLLDPMTGYRYSKAQSKNQPVFFAKTHAEERTLWRGVEALLVGKEIQAGPRGEEPDKVPRTWSFLRELKKRPWMSPRQQVTVELVGFVYGNQSALIANTIHEVLPFKLRSLISEDQDIAFRIVQAARRAVEASIHLGRFAGSLLKAAGGEYAFVPSASERALKKLETSFKEWILTIEPGVPLEERLNTWCDTVEALIKEEAIQLARGAGERALVGRMDDDNSEPPKVLNTGTAIEQLHASLKKTLERIPTEATSEEKGLS